MKTRSNNCKTSKNSKTLIIQIKLTNFKIKSQIKRK